MNVSKKRSALKAISWRFFATIITFVITYVATEGNEGLAIKITFMEIVVKTVNYYWHERIWNKISWGRK